MISPLHRKLLRNLRSLAGQVATIALVVAAGIATFVTLQGTYASLYASRDTYYEQQRFADVFARAYRVPRPVLARLETIPGVSTAYARISEPVSVSLPDADPIAGLVTSLPSDGRRPPLNGLVLRSGRWPEPGREEEVLLLDGFARARGIAAGDRLDVILDGRERELSVVGTALSPEFVFAVEPGNAMPEADAYAVIWMLEDAVAAAFAMEGAFNDLAVRLQPGANEAAVLDAIDRVLEPYGGFGAVDREHQESNYFLGQELGQLEQMATMVPVIFLGVAAFLLNVVLSRLIHLQRPEIASLKALGYSDLAIGRHFLELVVVVVTIGAAIGVVLGVYLGQGMMSLYTPYFHFPELVYRLDWRTAVTGVGVSLVAGVLGAAIAVRQVVRLPPAEAMRAPPPARYRRSLLERLGVLALFGTSARMVLRELTRRPLRLALSSLGISMAVAIMVAGRFGMDAFEHLIDQVFQRSMTEDLSVAFVEATPERAVRELAHLPGVTRAEGVRAVPVRFEHGPRHRDSVLMGYADDMTLRTLMDMEGRAIPVPREGILLNSKLAELLDVGVGETLRVAVREGERGTHDVPISGLIDEMYGLQGYMDIRSLNRLLREAPMVSMVLLDIEAGGIDEVQRRLRDVRGVSSTFRRTGLIERVRAQTGETWGAMTFILTLFAATIAVGVVYNNARVALSLRSRDLASLRVLGFTRGEISAILLGELAVQVLLAIPIGLLLGTWMAEGIMASADPERYRMPAVISSQTYAFATAVTLISGLFSALLVRRKLDQLDLIGVLKTRE